MEVVSAEVTDLNADSTPPAALNATKSTDVPHSILKFSASSSASKPAKKLSPTKGFEGEDGNEES